MEESKVVKASECEQVRERREGSCRKCASVRSVEADAQLGRNSLKNLTSVIRVEKQDPSGIGKSIPGGSGRREERERE